MTRRIPLYCLPKPPSQIHDEYRAGSYRDETAERKSFVLAAVRDGFGTVETIRSYVIGTGIPATNGQIEDALSQLVKQRLIDKGADRWTARRSKS